jgi:hypothetical protein
MEKEETKVEVEADQAEVEAKIVKTGEISMNTMTRDTAEVILILETEMTVERDEMKWKMRGNQGQLYQM